MSVRGAPGAIAIPAWPHPQRIALRRRVLPGAFLAALALFALPLAADSLVRHALAGSYGYGRLAIVYPGDRMTVFDDDGEIDVHVISMARRTARPGDRVELWLDGRPVSPEHDDSLILRDVAQGNHRLRARIVDADGRTLAESRTVRFFKWDAQPVQLHADGTAE
ncbi:hypothetical protein [Noviherbaspirillum agri]